MKQRRFLWLVLTAVVLIVASWTFLWFQNVRTPTLDERVQQVGSQLKCLVCQGESVADSQAGLAQEMRLIIREQLQEGKSDQQVIDYFVQRYGESIVWTPSWQGFGLLTWLVPIAFFLAGLILLFFVVREWLTSPSPRRTTPAVVSSSTTTATATETRDDDPWRARLEAELASEDILFQSRRKGATS